MGIGLLDGLLGTIQVFYEAGKKAVNTGTGLWKRLVSYTREVVNYGIRNRSLLKTIGKVWNDSVEKLKAAWNQIVEVYQLAKTFVNGVIANFKPIVQGIWEGIVSWLQGAINGEAGAGYDVGVLGFDVILTAFSAGTASGAKFLPKVMKWLERLKTDAKNMISGLLNEASSQINKVNGLAKKTYKCKILGKGCFVAGTPVLMAANNPFKTPIVACAMAVMPLVAPIQDIKPDDLVVSYHHSDRYLTASNDEGIYVPGWQSYDYLNITPETWQIGTFEIKQADGEKVEVEANRPKTWYHENKVKAIGDKTWFYMPEIGIHGEAVLLSVRPTVINTTNFALNQSGHVERPVITTFKRYAPVVYDYHFSDKAIIGATPEHPFFSMDRKAYIAVGELQLGEQVMTAGKRVVKFIAGKLRDKGEPVYNFEVWREHNYFVSGKDGGEWLLVHNACISPVKPVLPNMALVFDNWVNGFQPIIRLATTDYYRYQQRILGTLTERRIPLKKPHNFTKDNLDVDGFESSTGTLIDTKYVGDPSNSPYTGASQFPPIQDELLDEFNRFKHIIDDLDTPARQLKIITNHPDAVTYLEDLMNSLNIPGGVVLIR